LICVLILINLYGNLGFIADSLLSKQLDTTRRKYALNGQDFKMAVGEKVVISPDYKLAGGFFTMGALASSLGDNIVVGAPLLLIGAFLGLQTSRVRFEFDNEALEVKLEKSDGELVDSGENFKVGGQNRWKYSTFTHWQFYPSEELPILVYFKETQTSPEGQIHFFPVIMDGKALRDTMVEKKIPRLPIP